jgi:hypothetical protein
LFEDAKRVIIQAGKGSASFLQRRLKVGYARAARLLDELENAGVIGPGDGAKPREVLAMAGDMEDAGHEAGGEVNVFDDSEESGDEEVVEEECDSDKEEVSAELDIEEKDR